MQMGERLQQTRQRSKIFVWIHHACLPAGWPSLGTHLPAVQASQFASHLAAYFSLSRYLQFELVPKNERLVGSMASSPSRHSAGPQPKQQWRLESPWVEASAPEAVPVVRETMAMSKSSKRA
jgi:hypothetical protein